MKKRALLALLLSVIFPAIIFGQPVSPGLIPMGLPALPSAGEGFTAANLLSGLPLIQGLKTEKVLLNPFVQIGYQRTAVNMNVPIEAVIDPFPLLPLPHLQIGTTDVKLLDFNFWMGTAGTQCGNFPDAHVVRFCRRLLTPRVYGGGPDTNFLGSTRWSTRNQLDRLEIGILDYSVGNLLRNWWRQFYSRRNALESHLQRIR